MYKAGDRAAITTHFSYRGTIIIIAVVRTGRGRDVGYPIAAKTTKRGTERERMGTKPGTKGLKTARLLLKTTTNVYWVEFVPFRSFPFRSA